MVIVALAYLFVTAIIEVVILVGAIAEDDSELLIIAAGVPLWPILLLCVLIAGILLAVGLPVLRGVLVALEWIENKIGRA